MVSSKLVKPLGDGWVYDQDDVEFEKLARSGSEDGEQIALMGWAARAIFHQKYPQLLWLHHIPNGGGRSMAQGSLLKATGVKKGIPDLFLPVVIPGYGGLYIEMKKSLEHGGGKVSPEQKAFGEYALSAGYGWMVAYGWKEARTGLISYLEAGLGEKNPSHD